MLTIILIKAAIVIILVMLLLAWALHSIATQDAAEDDEDSVD